MNADHFDVDIVIKDDRKWYWEPPTLQEVRKQINKIRKKIRNIVNDVCCELAIAGAKTDLEAIIAKYIQGEDESKKEE